MTREQVSMLRFLKAKLSEMTPFYKMPDGVKFNSIEMIAFEPHFKFEFLMLKDGSKYYKANAIWYDNYDAFLDAVKDIPFPHWMYKRQGVAAPVPFIK